MIAFYALPVMAMLLRSVAEPHWTLDNLLRLGTDGVAMHVFLITFRTAAIVTIATAVIGYPVAFALAQMSRAWANPLLLLILLPFWTSVLVRTYAWMVLLGRSGVLNELLRWLGLIDQPMRILNTSLAVYVAMTHILLPYMILTDLQRATGDRPRAAARGGGSGCDTVRRAAAGVAAAIHARRGRGRDAGICPVARILHHARARRRATRHDGGAPDPAAG